jgi:hypothetical protein
LFFLRLVACVSLLLLLTSCNDAVVALSIFIGLRGVHSRALSILKGVDDDVGTDAIVRSGGVATRTRVALEVGELGRLLVTGAISVLIERQLTERNGHTQQSTHTRAQIQTG